MRLPSALPTLAGGWLKTFRIMWFALFAVAVVGGTAGTWIRFAPGWEYDRAIYGAGIRFVEEPTRLTVSPLAPETAEDGITLVTVDGRPVSDSPATANEAGILPGSTLVAVDGRPVKNRPETANRLALARALAGPDDAVKHLTLRSPDKQVMTVDVVRGPQYLEAADRTTLVGYAGRETFNFVAAYAINLILLVGAALLFWRWSNDPVVALLSTGMMLWPALDASYLGTMTELREKLVVVIGQGVVYLCLFSGIAAFPSGKFEPKWSLLVVPLMIFGLSIRLWPEPSQLPALRLTIIACSVAISVAAATRRCVLLPAGLQRQQIKWAVFGFVVFAVSFVVVMALNYLDTLVSDNRTDHFVVRVLMTLLTTFGFLALVSGLLVSLLHYRLYDADAAISRSAVYGTLTLGLVVIFSVSDKLVQVLGKEFVGERAGAAAGAVATGLAAPFLVLIHNRLTAWAERRFQRDLVRLRTRLPERLRDLQLTATPEAQAEAALAEVCAGVTATRAAILLPEGDGWRVAAVRGVSAEEAAAWLAGTVAPEAPARDSLFPAAWRLGDAGEPASGVLVLGPRPDGSLYGKDERATLEAIAEPLGRALAVAIARSAHEAAHEADRQSLSERIVGIEASLAGVLAQLAARPRRRAART